MYWHLATTWSHLATFWSHLATSLSQPGSTCFIKGKLLVIYIKLLSFLESCGHIWQLMVTQRKSNINELLMALPNFAQSIYLDCSFVRSYIRSFGRSVARLCHHSISGCRPRQRQRQRFKFHESHNKVNVSQQQKTLSRAHMREKSIAWYRRNAFKATHSNHEVFDQLHR